MQNKQIHPNKNDGKTNRKRITIMILLLLTATTLVMGGVAAYFSDVISNQGNATVGTLDISGSYQFYLNDGETPSTTIGNFNPGDTVKIKATIMNHGNKSAWVREEFSFDFIDASMIPFISIYSAEISRTELKQNSANYADYLLVLSPTNSSVSANRVLNGSGMDAEMETGNEYIYIESDTYEVIFTLYFSHLATNDTQGKNLTFTVKTQALQFRNNDEAEPNEDAWNTVVSTSFGN